MAALSARDSVSQVLEEEFIAIAEMAPKEARELAMVLQVKGASKIDLRRWQVHVLRLSLTEVVPEPENEEALTDLLEGYGKANVVGLREDETVPELFQRLSKTEVFLTRFSRDGFEKYLYVLCNFRPRDYEEFAMYLEGNLGEEHWTDAFTSSKPGKEVYEQILENNMFYRIGPLMMKVRFYVGAHVHRDEWMSQIDSSFAHHILGEAYSVTLRGNVECERRYWTPAVELSKAHPIRLGRAYDEMVKVAHDMSCSTLKYPGRNITSIHSTGCENVAPTCEWRGTSLSPKDPSDCLASFDLIHTIPFRAEGLPCVPFSLVDEEMQLHYWDWVVPPPKQQSSSGKLIQNFSEVDKWGVTMLEEKHLVNFIRDVVRKLTSGWVRTLIRSLPSDQPMTFCLQVRGVDWNGRYQEPGFIRVALSKEIKRDIVGLKILQKQWGDDCIPSVKDVVDDVPDAGGVMWGASLVELPSVTRMAPEVTSIVPFSDLASMYTEVRDAPAEKDGMRWHPDDITQVMNRVFGKVSSPNDFISHDSGKERLARLKKLGNGALASLKQRSDSNTNEGFKKSLDDFSNVVGTFLLSLDSEGSKKLMLAPVFSGVQHGNLSPVNVIVDGEMSVWMVGGNNTSINASIFTDLARMEIALLLELGLADPGDPDAADLTRVMDASLSGKSPWDVLQLDPTKEVSSKVVLQYDCIVLLRIWVRRYATITGNLLAAAAQWYVDMLLYVLQILHGINQNTPRPVILASIRSASLLMESVSSLVGASSVRIRTLAIWARLEPMEEVPPKVVAARPSSSKQKTNEKSPTAPLKKRTRSEEMKFEMEHQEMQYMRNALLEHSDMVDPISAQRINIMETPCAVEMSPMDFDIREKFLEYGREVVTSFSDFLVGVGLRVDANVPDTIVGGKSGRMNRRELGGVANAWLSADVVSGLSYLDDKLQRTTRHMLILGPAGSGKSVLAEQIFLHACFKRQQVVNGKVSTNRLPLHIALPDLVRSLKTRRDSESVELHGDLLTRYMMKKMAMYVDFISIQRKAGNLLVVMDGFDELNPNAVDAVVELIKMLHMEGQHLILMSRPMHWELLDSLCRETQWEWFGIRELSQSVRSQLVLSRLLDITDVERFLSAIRKDEHYARVTETPQLLFLLLRVYRTNNSADLPSDRCVLFNQCLLVLLRHLRDHIFDSSDDQMLRDMKSFLQLLAHRYIFHMDGDIFRGEEALSLETTNSSCTEGLVWPLLESAVRRGHFPLLMALEEETVENEDERICNFRFSSRVFAEYLSAAHIASEIEASMPSVSISEGSEELVRGSTAHTALQNAIQSAGMIVEKHFSTPGDRPFSRCMNESAASVASVISMLRGFLSTDGLVSVLLAAAGSTPVDEYDATIEELGKDEFLKLLVLEDAYSSIRAMCSVCAHFKRVSDEEIVKEGMRLRLPNCRIGPEEVTVIGNMLSHNETITDLNIYQDPTDMSEGIGVSGAAALASSLRENKYVGKLSISGNHIGDSGINTLSFGLKENRFLHCLDISNCGMTEGGLDSVSKLLNERENLTTLKLNGNFLGDRGFERFLDQVFRKETATLRALEIQKIGIKEDGAFALAAILKENCSLTELDMYYNKIGSDGAVEIGNAVAENERIKMLNLSGCRVRDEGALAFVEALKKNKNIVHLELQSNKISREVVEEFIEVRKECPALRHLDLAGNDFEESTVEQEAESSDLASALFGTFTFGKQPSKKKF